MYITFAIQDKGDGDKLYYGTHTKEDNAGFGMQDCPHHTLLLSDIIEDFKGAIPRWERLESSEKTNDFVNCRFHVGGVKK